MQPRSVQIFCRIIDNFGDAGVTLRVARRFLAEGVAPLLISDHLEVLAKLLPGLDPTAPRSVVDGIGVADWDAFAADPDAPADLVLETFGCRLPEKFEERMAVTPPKLTMNLDYLSAEDWVESCHGVWGLHPTLPIRKLWYFPGFTDRTGGLTIEPDYEDRRAAFDREAFLRSLGVTDPSRPTLYFFLYPTNDVVAWARALLSIETPLNVLLAPGEGTDALRDTLSAAPHPHRVIATPFVEQPLFDRYLWAADGVVIRGEDSFVRAQLSGTPLFWATYPTEDKAHEIKFEAWAARVNAVLGDKDVAESLALNRAWLEGKAADHDLAAWVGKLPDLRLAWAPWRASLFARKELVRGMLERYEEETKGV